MFVPFQNRPGTHPEPLPDLGWNGDLALSGKLRMSERHASDYHGNAVLPERHIQRHHDHEPHHARERGGIRVDASGQRISVGGTYARAGRPAALTSATYDDASDRGVGGDELHVPPGVKAGRSRGWPAVLASPNVG